MWRAVIVASIITVLGGVGCGGQPATPPKVWQTEGYALARLNDGRILVTGGIRYGTGKVNTAQLCDPATFKCSLTASMRDTRTGHTAITLRDGRVLIVGGSGDALFQSEARHSAEIYDPATGRWTKAADTAAPRYLHTATLLTDGRVLVVGGRFSDGAGAEYLVSGRSMTRRAIPGSLWRRPVSVVPSIWPFCCQMGGYWLPVVKLSGDLAGQTVRRPPRFTMRRLIAGGALPVRDGLGQSARSGR